MEIVCRVPNNCEHLKSRIIGGGLFLGCAKKKINFGHVNQLSTSKFIPVKRCVL